MRSSSPWLRTSTFALVILLAIGALSIFSGRALLGQRGGQVPTSATQIQSIRAATNTSKRLGPLRSAASPDLAQTFSWKTGNVFSPGALFLPMIMATKSATLGTDVNGNGFVNPGDTLMYSVLVSNTAVPGAGNDALNVVFTDQLNTDLTLVGTPIASPIGVNDAYASIGNVGITVPDGASDLLANDVSPDATAISVTAVNTAGTQGQVTFNANGSFTFMPLPGFEGMTTFTYTVTSTNGKTDTGIVTITVNEVIWFIDNNVSNGNGRLGSPFSSISNFNVGALDDPGDIIFVYRQTASDYTGSALTLLADQKLIGQGSTASLATSFTPNLILPPFSNPLPATGGARPTLTNTATNVTVSTGNTIRGVNVQSTAGTALTGTSFNNLNVSETTVNATNASGACTAAVNLDQASGTAAINVTFITVEASTCTNGIVLADTTGSFTVAGTSSGACGGGVTVQPVGTHNIVTAPNTVDCTGGTIQSSTGNGISLTNTSNVSLTRMWIKNNLGSGVFGDDLTGFSLISSFVDNNSDTATGVEANLRFQELLGTCAITNSTIQGAKEDEIRLTPSSGTLTNLAISGTVIGNDFNDGTEGCLPCDNGNGITISPTSTANVTVNLTNSVIKDVFAAGVVVNGDGTTSRTFNASNTTFSDPIADTAPVPPGGVPQQFGGVGISLQGSFSADLNFNVSNNTFLGIDSNAINFSIGTTATNNLDVLGTISGNVIGNASSDSGSRDLIGIAMESQGDADTVVFVTNNTTQHTDQQGFFAQSRLDNDADAETGRFDLILRDNNFGVIDDNTAFPFFTIHGATIDSRNTSTLCLDSFSNTSSSVGGVERFMLRNRDTSFFILERFDDGDGNFNETITNTTTVANFHNAQNDAGSTTLATLTGTFRGFNEAPDNTCRSAPTAGPTLLRPPGGDTHAKAALENPEAYQDDFDHGFVRTVFPEGMENRIKQIPPKLRIETPSSERIADSPTRTNQALQPAKQVQVTAPEGTKSSSLVARWRQWLTPVFSAFAAPMSYVNLDRVFNKAAETIVPLAAAAAENHPTEMMAAPAVPARTMLVNSKGEYRIVPTATLAGELITIAGTGSGFLLPAGESTTIMFNAQISASFTGTSITNQASVSGTGLGPILSNNLSTPVIQPPTIVKSFVPTNIALSGTNLTTSTLTLVLTNPNPSQALSGVAFTDTLTGGLQVDTTPTLVNGCGGTFTPALAGGQTALSYSGGSITAGGNCTISFKVRSTSVGIKTNATSGATSTQANAGLASNTATLNVLAAPSFIKAFGVASIAVGGTTSLTFNITNNDTSFGLTGIGFTDTLPAGLTVAASGPTPTCGGSLSTTAPSTISFSNGTLAAGVTCILNVTVTGTTAGTKPNSVSVTTTETGTNTTPATSSLDVFGPPTISKAFTPNSIVTGQTSTLNITVTNPATNPGTLTGISFTDTLPAGIIAPNSSTPSCNGGTLAVAANVITLTGGSLASGANCVNSVTVTGALASVTAYTNTISSVTSANGGTNNTPATANITVNKANTSLGFGSITDSPDPSVTGEPYTVGFTLSVTAPGSATPTAPTGTVTVNDGTGGTCTATLPATSCSLTSTTAGAKTVTVTYNGDSNFNTSNTTAGHQVNKADTTTAITLDSPDPSSPGQSVTVNFTVTPNSPGAGTPTGTVVVTVSGGAETCSGTVAAGTCNIVLTAPGNRTLTATYPGDANFNGSAGTEAHAVTNPPTVTKSFAPTQIKVGETSVMTFLVSNPNAALALTNISFSDTFPAGIEIDDPVVSTNTCGGSFSPPLAGAATSFSYVGGSLGFSGSCTISVQVKATSSGPKNNTTGVVTATETGGNATSNTATLTVVTPPVLTKAFALSTVGLGVSTSLSFIIDNNNANSALTGITFTDTLPAGLTVATSGPTPACGGSVSTTAPNTITLTGGTIGPGIPLPPSTCSFSVTVTPVLAGSLVNTSGVISATESGPGTTSNSATLTVTPGNTTAAIISDSPDPSVVGQGVTVTYTVSPVAPAVGTPTGNVLVSDGVNSCVGTVAAGSCVVALFTPGPRTLTATYQGNTNFNASPPSPGQGHQVNRADTTTTITSDTPDPSALGQNVTVNFTVVATAPGSGTPTGNVVVTISGGAETCTGTVAAGTCTLALTAIGNRMLVATYVGDLNYNFSSDSEAHQVNKADSTTTIASDNPEPSAVGQNVTVVFTVVATPPGAGTPSGNVTVTVSGGAETCAGTVAAGSCVLALTVPGNRTLTATYAGDTNFNGSSDTESHTVIAPPSIAKAFAPTSTPIGGTSTLTFTITNPAVNTVSLTGVGFTDTFPVGVLVANPLTTTNTCGGTLQDNTGGVLALGDPGIRLTGGTVGVGVPCMVSVNVTPTVAGPHVNVSGNVTSTNGGTGNTATATLQTNTPPTISSETITVQAGSNAASFTIATAADPDQPANTLGITINGNPTTATSNGVTVSGVTITPSGAVTANVSTTCAATSASFNLVVTDNETATGTGTLTVTVTPNLPPVLGYSTQSVTAGTTPSFGPAVGPSDNGTITSIVLQSITPNSGLSVSVNSATGGVQVISASLAGSYLVTIVATDNCSATTPASFTVNVVCPTVTLSPVSLPNATVNTPYPQTITASPAGGNYTFAVTSGALPSGLTLNSNGSFSGAATVDGVFNFRVTATGFGSCTGFRDYSLTVICPTITLNPASLPGGTVGTAYSQTVSASPAGSYSYSVSGGALPIGLSLNPSTGAITGTPTTTGLYNFTITAAAGGCTGSRTYSVTIVCPTITILPAALPNGQAGSVYSQALSVSPSGTYTFSLILGSLPSGVTLNATTGVISGLPTVVGSYNFTVGAAAGNGCSGTKAYTLVIECPTISVLPVSLPAGTKSVFYSQTFSAMPAGGSYTFAKTTGTLPTGLTLNAASGVLSGYPNANGTFTFRMTATGFGSCSAFRDYTVVIGGGGCPTITLPATLPNGSVGSLYNKVVSASPAGLYTYTVSAGSLPPGLTFYGSMGLIFGYPTTVGMYNFTITATDASACTASSTYVVTIGPAGSFMASPGTEVLAVVSAASYRPGSSTPGGIMAAFGNGLAVSTEPAATIPLPTELAGTVVVIKDSAGVEYSAPLFFVSPGQVNFQIPDAAAIGEAVLTVTSADGSISEVRTEIVPVAPGLFAANGDGAGAAAGYFVHVAGDSSQMQEPTAIVDSLTGLHVPTRVAFGEHTEELFVVLHGTGLRGRGGLEAVTVSIGGEECEVTYAGPQGVYVGLDQINVRLPRTLAGRGEIEIVVTIEGREANTLRLRVQ